MAVLGADKEFHQRIGQLEKLLQQIDQIADTAARDKTHQIVQLLMDFHGAGLAKIMEIIAREGVAGQPVIAALSKDDLVSHLLLLYDLHPLSLEDRVKQALEKVRPYLRSHKGNVEFIAVREGVVHLRMAGSCHGCPSSAMTLKLAIEEAIYEKAPDAAGIQVEGVVEPAPPSSNFVPVEQLTMNNGHRQSEKATSWVQVDGLATLVDGAIRQMLVAEHSILFCRANGTLYAYSNDCPACAMELDQAVLSDTALKCPGCGHHFDIQRAGASLDGGRFHLEPFPLLEENDCVKVAVQSQVAAGVTQ